MPRSWILLRWLRVLLPRTQSLVIDNFSLFFNSFHKVGCCLLGTIGLLRVNLQVLVHSLRVVVLYLVLEMTQKKHFGFVKQLDKFSYVSLVLSLRTFLIQSSRLCLVRLGLSDWRVGPVTIFVCCL